MDKLADSMENNISKFGQIHVEVLQSATSSATTKEIERRVRETLQQKPSVFNNHVFQKGHFSDSFLNEHVDKITVSASGCSAREKITVTKDFFNVCRIHVYRVIQDDPCVEELENEDGSSNDNVAAGRHWTLPNQEFEGLWENLIFDTNIKEEMMNYAETMLHFADQNVDPHVITFNRMLLFHGPPGTGKTTLCKALAQKLSIRLNQRYQTGRFLEVNSHSLFSKWFSESGKLVTKLFEKIHQLLEDEGSLLVILIDEVESLTVARRQALAGNEPSDAVRVVNALLTQIDYIRRWPNVLILTTSNLSEAVDPAFLDRADIKQYIGPPSPAAIYSIFFEAIMELRRTGIITASDIPLVANFAVSAENESSQRGAKLLEIAHRCKTFSGRTIRKLPLLAYAYKFGAQKSISADDFINALDYAVAKQLKNDLCDSENGAAGDSNKYQSSSPHRNPLTTKAPGTI